MANIRTTLFILLMIIANIGCSAHCDDEDYEKAQQEKKVVHLDTLQIDK